MSSESARAHFAVRIAAVLVIAAALARVASHPWNFTPTLAIALFAGATFAHPAAGVAISLAALALSDAALGLFPYDGMAWTYGAFVAVAILGRVGARPLGLASARAPSVALAALAAIGAGALFFAVSNFGVWAAGVLYPRTGAGLVACFVAAVPFYRNQLAGDVAFTTLLFGARALALHAHARHARAAAR